jgi:hypothetical protein
MSKIFEATYHHGLQFNSKDLGFLIGLIYGAMSTSTNGLLFCHLNAGRWGQLSFSLLICRKSTICVDCKILSLKHEVVVFVIWDVKWWFYTCAIMMQATWAGIYTEVSITWWQRSERMSLPFCIFAAVIVPLSAAAVRSATRSSKAGAGRYRGHRQ